MTHTVGGIDRPIRAWLGVLLLGIGMAAGCATPNRPSPAPAQSHLIGKTKHDLIACAGAPLEEAHKGQQTMWRYHKDAPTFDQSFFGSKASVRDVHHDCTALVTLADDRVLSVEYRPDPPSVAGNDHCEAIFQRCAP
jgi:hypothetical protein